MNDSPGGTYNAPPPPDPQPTAFCQNCGKPLTPATLRQVGASTFCEPCLEARVNATTSPSPGYQPVGVAGTPPMPESSLPPGSPSPALALVLGFIPGVGAMYNEQYSKGIVHLIVFVFLVSLSDDVNGVFGIFVAGWIGYMAFDAFHTARARALGTPLPDPFGLNDIGERLGFTKLRRSSAAQPTGPAAWPGPQQPASSPVDPPPTQQTGWTASNPGTTQPYAQPHNQPQPDPFATPPVQTAPQPPYTPVSQADPMPNYPVPVAPPSRFPTGAVWLIAIGCFFLLTTTGIFSTIHPEAVIGFALIGLAAYTFVRRMTETGATITDDGSPYYRYRLLRCSRGSIWLAFIGLWLVIGSFDRFIFHRFWPVLIILAGVLALLERVALNSAPPPPTNTL